MDPEREIPGPKFGFRRSVGGVTIRVLREGVAPPCMARGEIPCRGCSGWRNMMEAMAVAGSLWRSCPIHCSATGVTVIGEDLG